MPPATTVSYDPTGLVLGEKQPISSSASINVSFGYDLTGNRTRFTDGRGNVPLDASLRGTPPSGVRREGVDDALRVAATAATLHRVRSVVIAPDLDQYPELPVELAEALGATLVVAAGRVPGAPA